MKICTRISLDAYEKKPDQQFLNLQIRNKKLYL